MRRDCLKSNRSRRCPRIARAGVTLMELLLVIALFATMAVLTAMSFGMLGGAETRGEALRMSSIVRYVYNEAVAQNRTLQLVIDLDNGTIDVDDLNTSGGLSEDALMGTSLVTAENDEDEDTFGIAARRGSTIDDEDTEFVSIQRSPYSTVLEDTEKKLKEGVYFLGVMTSHHEELQTEGKATINFFPNGFVERSIIYLGDEEAKNGNEDEGGVYTLMINPMTGQSTIKPGRIPVTEKFFEAEEDNS